MSTNKYLLFFILYLYHLNFIQNNFFFNFSSCFSTQFSLLTTLLLFFFVFAFFPKKILTSVNFIFLNFIFVPQFSMEFFSFFFIFFNPSSIHYQNNLIDCLIRIFFSVVIISMHLTSLPFLNLFITEKKIINNYHFNMKSINYFIFQDKFQDNNIYKFDLLYIYVSGILSELDFPGFPD